MEILYDVVKIGVVFGCLICGTKKLGMAAALGLGVLGFALLSGLPPASYLRVTGSVLTGQSFWYLEVMMICLLTFTETFVKSGQCDRMVHGLEAYVTSPKTRLILFPMLLALLPAPGGAILSCPMVDSAGKSMRGLNNERLAVINYWFRHVLETVWPFYPGYLLVCVMGSVSMATLPLYTFPIMLASLLGGWIFLLRGITLDATHAEDQKKSVSEIVMGAMPLLVTVLVGLISVLLSSLTGIGFFRDWAFAIAPVMGTVVCLFMTGRSPRLALECATAPRVRQILLLMIAIFYFKEFLAETRFIEPFVEVTKVYNLLPLVFIVVSFIGGLAVGLYAGFVAICFPVLMPMLEASPALWDNRIAYVFLAVLFGQMGEQLSPTHACFMFSCGYFKAHLGGTWRRLLLPVALVMILGYCWFLMLRTA